MKQNFRTLLVAVQAADWVAGLASAWLQGGGCQQMAQVHCLMLSVSLSQEAVAQQGQLFVPKEKAEDILSFWLWDTFTKGKPKPGVSKSICEERLASSLRLPCRAKGSSETSCWGALGFSTSELWPFAK